MAIVGLMPSKKNTGKKHDSVARSYIDVFSRMDESEVKKLDELADDQHRSRSAMVAWIVEQFIATEYPKLKAKLEGR